MTQPTIAKYRNQLPQLSPQPYITDGGLETTLIFREGIDIPEFAAFDLLKQPSGYQSLYDYYRTYALMAQTYKVGLILEAVTWRANADWGTKLGYSTQGLAEMNHASIALLQQLREEYETAQSTIVISGCIGPRGDGYAVEQMMDVETAMAYHYSQIKTLCQTGADLVSALTMNYVEEAIGIVRAAQQLKIPVVISFTLETNGKLPTGQSLGAAIEQVDAATQNGPAYYMVNCAHPLHFAHILQADSAWGKRIRGLRANASMRSHAELDTAEDLDDGNPLELGQQYRDLLTQLPNLNILGGCCGTDERHIDAICKACLPVLWSHLTQGQLLSLTQ